jgi:hypothetical protein
LKRLFQHGLRSRQPTRSREFGTLNGSFNQDRRRPLCDVSAQP